MLFLLLLSLDKHYALCRCTATKPGHRIILHIHRYNIGQYPAKSVLRRHVFTGHFGHFSKYHWPRKSTVLVCALTSSTGSLFCDSFLLEQDAAIAAASSINNAYPFMSYDFDTGNESTKLFYSDKICHIITQSLISDKKLLRAKLYKQLLLSGISGKDF